MAEICSFLWLLKSSILYSRPVQAHLDKMEKINRMVSAVMDRFGRVELLHV
jgi:hypothetical protein